MTQVDYTYRSLEAQFLSNTCCHWERVVGPDGLEFMALWNGLAPWLKILSFANGKDLYGGANVVQDLQSKAEEDEDGQLYLPNAGIYLALDAGYQLAPKAQAA